MAVPKGFFPQQDPGRLTGGIQAEQDISFQAMQEKLKQFVAAVQSDPDVTNLVAFCGGNGGTNSGRMFASLTDSDSRTLTIDEIIAWRDYSASEKRAVLAELPERRTTTDQTGSSS